MVNRAQDEGVSLARAAEAGLSCFPRKLLITVQPTTNSLCVAEKPSVARSIAGILSGGQYQTVGLLEAILSACRMCFVDELPIPC